MCHANPCNPSRKRFTKFFMVISVISVFQMYFGIWDADKTTTSPWAMPLAVFRWLSPCLVTSSNSSRVHGDKSDKPHLISSVHVFTKKRSSCTSWNNSTAQKNTFGVLILRLEGFIQGLQNHSKARLPCLIHNLFSHLLVWCLNLSSACVLDIRSFIFSIQALKVSSDVMCHVSDTVALRAH